MKKTRVMSTIAMVIFILALILEILNDIIYYTDSNSGGLPVDWEYVIQNVLTFTLPAILGMLLLIIGVKLAAANKAAFIYPIGFLVIATSYIITLYNVHDDKVTIRNALLVISLILLALDGFIRPRVKVMGILGAIALYIVSLVFYFVYFGDVFGYSFDYSSYNLIWLFEIFAYYSCFQFIAIGALLYAIGRQPRVARIPQVPQYPNNYQQNYQQKERQYIPPDHQSYNQQNNQQYNYPQNDRQDNDRYPY